MCSSSLKQISKVKMWALPDAKVSDIINKHKQIIFWEDCFFFLGESSMFLFYFISYMIAKAAQIHLCLFAGLVEFLERL